MTQEDLREYFEAFPGVTCEKIDLKNKFAFVEFGSENDADLLSSQYQFAFYRFFSILFLF